MNRESTIPGAIVTGSSRGIGAAIARRLASAGYGVAINYVKSADRAEALAEEIRDSGGRAITVRADVSDYGEVARLVEQAASAFGGIRVVVNNAGYSQHRSIEEMTIGDWNRAIAINLSAAMFTVKASLPHLRRQPWGRIINICSLRAMTGSDHGAHYAAAKSGLIGLTKSLATLAEKGEEIYASIPAGRAAEPDEIAALVAFLASEDAAYITGETINANGGIYMR